MIEVSIIIPSYNDDRRYGECLSRLYRLPLQYEYLIADQKGKGRAIVETAKKARGDIIVTCDTDFMQVNLIPEYVKMLKEKQVDLIVPRRTYTDRPLHRNLLTSGFRSTANVLFGGLPDTQHGFKVFRKTVIEHDYKLKGFAWDVEFVNEAKKAGYKILETEMNIKYTRSNFKSLKSTLTMGFELLSYWLSDNWNKLYFMLSILFFASLFYASYSTAIPIGADVHFHLDVAKVWARGENGMFSDRVFTENLFPYPPLFHWLLVPSIWLNFEYLACKFFQVSLPFLIYLSTTLFMSRNTNHKTAALTALVMLSSVGFIDGTIQCRPMGFAMIFIPLAYHYLAANKNRLFALPLAIMGYSHGIAALANLWLPTTQKFLNRKNLKYLVLVLLVLAPLLISSVVYFGGALDKWSGHHDSYQEYLIFTSPQTMIPYYSGMSIIGWVYVAYALSKWNEASSLMKTLTLSLLGLTIMIPLWSDRFLQYSTLTLSCVAALGISRNKRLSSFLVPLLAVMAVANIVNIVWVTWTGNWWLFSPS